MFKNITILALVVLLLIVVCNSTFGVGGFHFSMPSHSTETKVERQLMSAARLIEQAKTDKALKRKVEQILVNWDN